MYGSRIYAKIGERLIIQVETKYKTNKMTKKKLAKI